jgi:hypothetical protein
MKRPISDTEFSEDEKKERFAAALRGARIAGHKPMTDVPKKRASKPKKKRATGKEKI